MTTTQMGRALKVLAGSSVAFASLSALLFIITWLLIPLDQDRVVEVAGAITVMLMLMMLFGFAAITCALVWVLAVIPYLIWRNTSSPPRVRLSREHYAPASTRRVPPLSIRKRLIPLPGPEIGRALAGIVVFTLALVLFGLYG